MGSNCNCKLLFASAGNTPFTDGGHFCNLTVILPKGFSAAITNTARYKAYNCPFCPMKFVGCCFNFICSSRRMPGQIREFNSLEPHSSHDLVFKIWQNNKTEATFGVFLSLIVSYS